MAKSSKSAPRGTKPQAQKPAPKPRKLPTKRAGPGRPVRTPEKACIALGIDPREIDPRRILASIAADKRAPAGARVLACRVLITSEGPAPKPDEVGEGADQPMDSISA